jgi:hypothetical protein
LLETVWDTLARLSEGFSRLKENRVTTSRLKMAWDKKDSDKFLFLIVAFLL